MAALALLGLENAAQGRAADDCSAHRGEAAARRLPASVRVAQLWAGDAAARMALRKLAQRCDRARRRLDVRVRGDHERRARFGDTAVDVGAEAERALVLDQ